VTSAKLSGQQWSKVRQAWGGKDSGLVSTQRLRSELRDLREDETRAAVATETGARLVIIRDALECLLAEIENAGLWVDRLVRDGEGRPTSQTEDYTAKTDPGPYTQHSDRTRDMHVCVGLYKGGTRSSCKLVMTMANQRRPQRREYSILMATYPSTKDGHAELCEMIGPWAADLDELLASGVTVDGHRRAVRFFLNGDFMFLSNVIRHLGPTCHMSCLWCLAVRVPSDTSKVEAATYGSMQLSAELPRELRSRKHLEDMASTYSSEGNSSLPLPLTLGEHFSIERRPLLFPYPHQIVPLPLHLTLGLTSFLLQLGITAAVDTGGEAGGRAAAAAVGASLLADAGVRTVGYHGGSFEGRACHRITAMGTAI